MINDNIAMKGFTLSAIIMLPVLKMAKVNYHSDILCNNDQKMFINVQKRNCFSIYLDVALEICCILKIKRIVHEFGGSIICYHKSVKFKSENFLLIFIQGQQRQIKWPQANWVFYNPNGFIFHVLILKSKFKKKCMILDFSVSLMMIKDVINKSFNNVKNKR